MPTDFESEILCRLQAIEARIEAIDARTTSTHAHCEKMGGHIDFVERVYNAVRRGISVIPGMPGLPMRGPSPDVPAIHGPETR